LSALPAKARRVLGLPREGPIASVSGGGWGVGDLEGATRAALDIPELTVVCLAGRDRVARSRLEAVFAAEVRVRVLGFTSDMNDLLAAADVVVHSTGGITALEAIARDRPLVAYGAPPGHARLIASTMASIGLAGKADSPAELTTALRDALTRPRLSPPKPSTLPSAAQLVVAARSRVGRSAATGLARGAAWRSTMQRSAAQLGEGRINRP
jgi:UDP-N-acetylglucosamine:LPS N-acetylglucosamine transferase